MKQTKWLSEFTCPSEYTRFYPNAWLSYQIDQEKKDLQQFSLNL